MKRETARGLRGVGLRVASAGILSGVALAVGVFPFPNSAALRAVQKVLVYLDAPISGVSLLLPWKGAWYFWFPDGMCRGVAGPDLARVLQGQLLIGVPTYTLILYLPKLVVYVYRSLRGTFERSA